MKYSPNAVLPCLVSLCMLLSACDYWVSDATRLERASHAKARGDYGLAAIELRNVLQRQPDSLQPRLDLVDVLLLNGEVPAANSAAEPLWAEASTDARVAELRVRVELAAGNAQQLLAALDAGALALSPTRVLLVRGQAQLQLGNLEAAEELFKQVRAADADSEDARLSLAQIYAMRNDVERALDELAPLTKSEAPHSSALRLRGMLLSAAGEPVAALNALTLAREHAGGHLSRQELTTLLAARIEQLLTLERIDDAQATLKELVAHDPTAVVTSLSKGQVALAQKEYATAAAEMQGLLARQPGVAQARLLLGKVLYAQERWEQAEQQVLQLVAEQPQLIEARTLLARLYLRDQRPDKAIEVLAPTIGAERPEASALLVEAQQAAAQSDATMAELSGLVARKPSEETLRVTVAATYLRAGQADKAIELLQQEIPGSGVSAANSQRVGLILTAVASRAGITGAQREAERLAKLPAADSKTLLAIGRFFAQVRQGAQARQWLQRATERESNNASMLIELAQVSLATGDLAAAERAAERVLALRADNMVARLLLAECAVKRGDVEKAFSHLAVVREQHPGAIQPLLAAAAIQIQRGKASSAEPELRAARALASERAGALAEIARLWVAAKRPSEGAEALTAATKLQPNSARLWGLLSEVELMRGEFAAARDAGQKAFEMQPDIASLRLLLQAYGKLDQSDTALKLVRDFRASRPQDIEVAILEGDALMQARDYVSAGKVYEALLEQLSKAPIETTGTASDRATALMGTRVATKAAQARRAAKQPDPNAPIRAWLQRHDVSAARLALAEGYRTDGDLTRAIETYQQVLARTPNDITALNNLAVAYFDAKDPRALATARKAYDLLPTMPAVADTYGWILLHADRVGDALPILKSASADRQSPEITYHYAVALSRAGQVEAAREALQSALAQSVEFTGRADAERLLKQLQMSDAG